MTNKNKLKVLVGILLIFIVILVALLIYATTVYKNNDKPVSPTNISQSAASTASASQSASEQSEVPESIELKLYFFDADDYDNVKEIRTVTVDKKLFQEDKTSAINKVLESTNLRINNAIINGKAITVDLPKEVALSFNNGSAGGITNTNILAMTILNIPDIEKMEVTVDGVAGVVADHFNFNGTFSKTEDGKKYIFTESDKESKYLDF